MQMHGDLTWTNFRVFFWTPMMSGLAVVGSATALRKQKGSPEEWDSEEIVRADRELKLQGTHGWRRFSGLILDPNSRSISTGRRATGADPCLSSATRVQNTKACGTRPKMTTLHSANESFLSPIPLRQTASPSFNSLSTFVHCNRNL